MLRAAEAQRRQTREMAIFAAWRTATLTRADKMPTLSRLLKVRRKPTPAQLAQARADVAAAEAAWARYDAEQAAQAKGGTGVH